MSATRKVPPCLGRLEQFARASVASDRLGKLALAVVWRQTAKGKLALAAVWRQTAKGKLALEVVWRETAKEIV